MAGGLGYTPGTGATVNTETVTSLNGGAVSPSPQDVQRIIITLRTGAGVVVDVVGDAANGVDVDVTRIVPGTGPTELGKAEDSVHASGDVGVAVWGVRSDTPAAKAGDGDYHPFLFDNTGRQYVHDPVVAAAIASAVSGETPAGDEMIGHVGGVEYQYVAASQTNSLLGAGGTTGDYLSHLLVVPATTSPGAVSVKDASGGTSRTVFTGGASSVGDLRPFPVPLGAKSTAGGWYVTTGANVAVMAFGQFT